jgi:hypothetical protein
VLSMLRTSSRLTAVALAATALVPAAAVAAGVHPHPHLQGSPQMRIVDSHYATLNFAADRLPRTAAGKVDATITFVNGARVSGLKPTGTHGTDIKYSARVSSQRPLRLHAKYTVKFRLGDSGSVTRPVKLFAPGEHG